ncbi:MAG: triose-phosphate isomerase [Deltaproteobacteria bacterium]|nr:triose-phosphate isomerase [Deltaproteobacteria bacterium]
MRRPLLVANWKMHKSVAEAEDFAAALLPLLPPAGAELAIAPPFTALAALGRALRGSPVLLAAQNANPAESGAFTGEVAPAMLAELGCRYVIAGHSERRGLYGESDDFVAAKVCALLAAGLRPIVCVGESLEVRRAGGGAAEVVCRQLQNSLAGVPAGLAAELAVAYEPIWAIGTGETATPQAAQQMHAALREKLRGLFGAAAEAIRIQYGGSVKPGNAAALLAQPDIDGALVGGASLNPESFAALAAESGGAS